MTPDVGREWHADAGLLDAHARGELSGLRALSVETHLVLCPACRSALAGVTDQTRLDRMWGAIRAGIANEPRVAAARGAAAAQGPAAARGAPVSPRGPVGARWGPRGFGRLAPRMVLPVALIVLVAAVGRVVASGGPDPLVAIADPSPSPRLRPPPPPAEIAPETQDFPAPPTAPPPAADPPVQAAAFALVPFDTCDDLTAHLRREAGERVGAWGLADPSGMDTGGGVMVGGADEVAGGTTGTSSGTTGTTGTTGGSVQQSAPAAQAPRSGPSSEFSTTNVQEVGVDEPDHVKTDGRYAYVASGTRLAIVDIADGTARLVSHVDLGDVHSTQLLLAGDRLLAISGVVRSSPEDSPWYYPPRRTGLTLLDVADRSQPTIVEYTEVEGSFVNARLVEQYARVVVRGLPPSLPFVWPDGERTDEQALEHNRAVVARSTPDDWLPAATFSRPGGDPRSRRLGDCNSVHAPVEFAGWGTVSVLSVDLGGRLDDLHTTTVLADAETVYASAETLYVATNRWFDPSAGRVDPLTTEVHAFDIRDPFASGYLASGTVPGYLVNQFALSEHAGHLRVATTESWAPQSESAVRVLRRDGRVLVAVGEVGGLGVGERIYAVRYLGDLGFVVTFRQVDPLYTLDLSDPTAPRVVGELKIPGYSSYLHPVAPGVLLGIGQDATDEGWTVGTQLSVFDVSDLADPRQVDKHVIDAGSSGAESDHRAFLHWPATGLVMAPLTVHSRAQDGQWWTGAVAFELDGLALRPLGEVAHPREYGYEAAIERSFVVGGTVYTLSSVGLLASDVRTLDMISWLPLQVSEWE